MLNVCFFKVCLLTPQDLYESSTISEINNNYLMVTVMYKQLFNYHKSNGKNCFNRKLNASVDQWQTWGDTPITPAACTS